ncbi:hypothetical protein RRG08_022452 [Elysia crispata]|uniref:Uncharacterized protein n=1 Tax=Elysia crispata TaxID=231223 RepID=A0AAE0Z2F8_9GAST|nr:hypothetical protein RRG08_022452 [Elysia crispata]
MLHHRATDFRIELFSCSPGLPGCTGQAVLSLPQVSPCLSARCYSLEDPCRLDTFIPPPLPQFSPSLTLSQCMMPQFSPSLTVSRCMMVFSVLFSRRSLYTRLSQSIHTMLGRGHYIEGSRVIMSPVIMASICGSIVSTQRRGRYTDGSRAIISLVIMASICGSIVSTQRRGRYTEGSRVIMSPVIMASICGSIVSTQRRGRYTEGSRVIISMVIMASI